MRDALTELYSWDRAVADGVLREVTDLAEAVGLHADVFISAGYWNDPGIARSASRLRAALRTLRIVFGDGRGTTGDHLDGQVLWTSPGGLRSGPELAQVLHLDRDGRGRLRLTILARGERLDWRIVRPACGGSFFTM